MSFHQLDKADGGSTHIGAYMYKLLALLLVTVGVVGCKDEPAVQAEVHNYDYYMTHPAEREAKRKACKNADEALSIECQNAAKATADSMAKGTMVLVTGHKTNKDDSNKESKEVEADK